MVSWCKIDKGGNTSLVLTPRTVYPALTCRLSCKNGIDSLKSCYMQSLRFHLSYSLNSQDSAKVRRYPSHMPPFEYPCSQMATANRSIEFHFKLLPRSYTSEKTPTMGTIELELAYLTQRTVWHGIPMTGCRPHQFVCKTLSCAFCLYAAGARPKTQLGIGRGTTDTYQCIGECR